MLLGYLTVTGSLIAFGKLQGIVRDRAWVFRGQNLMNLAVLAVGLVLVVALTLSPVLDAAHPVPDRDRAPASGCCS